MDAIPWSPVESIHQILRLNASYLIYLIAFQSFGEMSPVGEPPEPLQTLHERLYQAAVNGEAQKISELFKLGAKMSTDEVSNHKSLFNLTSADSITLD